MSKYYVNINSTKLDDLTLLLDSNDRKSRFKLPLHVTMNMAGYLRGRHFIYMAESHVNWFTKFLKYNLES